MCVPPAHFNNPADFRFLFSDSSGRRQSSQHSPGCPHCLVLSGLMIHDFLLILCPSVFAYIFALIGPEFLCPSPWSCMFCFGSELVLTTCLCHLMTYSTSNITFFGKQSSFPSTQSSYFFFFCTSYWIILVSFRALMSDYTFLSGTFLFNVSLLQVSFISASCLSDFVQYHIQCFPEHQGI